MSTRPTPRHKATTPPTGHQAFLEQRARLGYATNELPTPLPARHRSELLVHIPTRDHLPADARTVDLEPGRVAALPLQDAPGGAARVAVTYVIADEQPIDLYPADLAQVA